MSTLFGRKTLCIVTGASRGIGREISVQFSEQFGEGSLICLASRGTEALNQTRTSIEEALSKVGRSTRVLVHSIDFGTAGNAELDSLLDAIAVSNERFDVFMLIHNAGTLICEKLSTDFHDIAVPDNYFHLNFSSAVVLTSKCVARFSKLIDGAIVVVSISSLLSVKPYAACSMYCAVKAARDLYFSSLAEEFKANLPVFGDGQSQNKPTLRVLNYAPGPVHTEMARQIAEDIADPNVRESIEDRASKLLTCTQTVSKLVRLLTRNEFTSGAHIDYFDPEPETTTTQ